VIKSKVALIALALGLTACGKVGDLEPRSGNSLPPKALGQKSAQAAEALTMPSAQARPGRTDELLRRSERREDDPFDVPPGKEPKPFDAQKAGEETVTEAKENPS
jgi:predicted small lipoprotein YifL